MEALGLLLVGAVVAASGSAASHVEEPTRRAVVIGIDRYSAALEDLEVERVAWSPFAARDITDLENAVADAESFAALLTSRFGFEDDDVVLLRDEEATRVAILASIEAHLVDAARPGDTSVLYFVGHGSRIQSSHADAIDGRDQTLVPADSLSGARDIWDKEIAYLLNDALDRGAQVTAIFGSCFSGDIARGDNLGSRGLRPPHCVQMEALDAYADRAHVLDDTRAAPAERGAIVLTASGPDQVAWAVPKEVQQAGGVRTLQRGIFGWHLVNALRRAPLDESAWNVFLRVKARMRADPRPQLPMFEPRGEGAEVRRTRPLFGTAPPGVTGQVMLGVIGLDLDAGEIIVDGGYAHGLVEGCELTLAGEGEGRPARCSFEIRTIESLNRSRARWVGGSVPLDSLDLTHELLEVTAWGAPDEPLLRLHLPPVWPEDLDDDAVFEFADGLRSALGGSWLDDPFDVEPTHVVRYDGDCWRVETATASHIFDRLPAREELIALLEGSVAPRLFLQLPIPGSLAGGLRRALATSYTYVDEAPPSTADYTLTGRAGPAGIEYAWVRPLVPRSRSGPAPPRAIPGIAAWTRDDELQSLRSDIEALGRIRGWTKLDCPPRPRTFPYRLTVQGLPLSQDGTEHIALAGMPLRFEFSADKTPRFVRRRHVYLIGIDGTEGWAVDLTEAAGIENAPHPLEGSDRDRIVLLPPVISTGEPSISTFVGLTSETRLEDRSSLSWRAIRQEPLSPGTTRTGSHALQMLIDGMHGARRSSAPRIDNSWSVDQVQIRSTDLIPEPGSYEIWCVSTAERDSEERVAHSYRFIASEPGELVVRVARTDPETDARPSWNGCRRDDASAPTIRLRTHDGDPITDWGSAERSVRLDAGEAVNVDCGYTFTDDAASETRVAKLILEIDFVRSDVSDGR